MKMGQEVFAVDIGTRTIVGLVVRKEGRGFSILAQEVVEHESRAMYDGQIHDVEAVARNVRRVKESLEKKLGHRLEKVAVAAAGRALLTVEAAARKETSPYVEITGDDIRSLEVDALANAVKALSSKNSSGTFENYHCVGYSVIKWFLEDDPLDNLLGQKGRSISVKIVATFLPRVVVESLITVLKRCDLELYSITLEPIAASSVVVLPNMRKLNIALVDIGAGTSDIALSRDGSIFAYGMVPMAGDEITEKICETFLLDFDEGERVKRELLTKDRIQFRDILGQEHEIPSADVLEAIKPAVFQLSSEIARKIVELNGKTPAAVLCVGGGSLMPGLTEYIAANLELPKERVGIRDRESINFVKGGEGLSGPFAVTPIGIAVNALEGTNLSFIKVHVNEKLINILGQQKPTVLNALLHGGIAPADIFGRPGMALTFKLNGELKIVKGRLPRPAVITMNGEQVGLNAEVADNAVIKFEPACSGEDARAKIRDFLGDEDKMCIKINGREFSVDPHITMNDSPASPDDDIVDDAEIIVKKRELILSDIFNIISFKPEGMTGKLVMKINGLDAGFTSPVKSGDEVEIYWKNMP